MPKLFASITDESVPDDRSSQLTEKFYRMHQERVQSLKQLMNIPAENEITFLWTLKSFNAFTFIPFLIAHFGTIDELYLSTYTVNRRIADALIRQLDNGKIGSVNIFVSESIKFRMPDVIDHLNNQMLSRPKITLQYAWNHSKITCARCGENYFIFEGSGNWSENAQYEQYILINSKNIYEFRKKNITGLE